MNPLIHMIPATFSNFIGLSLIMGIFVMGGTFFQEWAKSLYRKLNGKNGGNRRVEEVLVSLVEEIKRNNDSFHKLMESHEETKETVDIIARKQERNWERLFQEELKSTCKAKPHGT